MAAAKTHLSLNVRDLEKSIAFYRAFFGVEPHKFRHGYANFDIASPPLKLALNAYTGDFGRSSLNHLGILVDSPKEVEEAKSRLEASGLVELAEENVECCYAKQDKVWVRDPDGNAWEVYAILDDMLDDSDEPRSENEPCCASTCCA